MRAAQLPIDFGHRPAFSAEDFLVAPCNAQAHGWIMRWPAWNALGLIGPVGSGKSHLAHLFAAKSNAAIVTARSLTLDDPPRLAEIGAVVVEDVDQGASEQALLHLYNLILQTKGTLLVTGRDEPSRWGIGLADLGSRLAALQVATIGPPDDALLGALLLKLFADRQIRVGADVLAYLAPRMERSFDCARALVDALDNAALAGKRPVSVPLARDVLSRLLSRPDLD